MPTSVFREDVERCLAAGINTLIGKPVIRIAFESVLFRLILCNGAQTINPHNFKPFLKINCAAIPEHVRGMPEPGRLSALLGRSYRDERENFEKAFWQEIVGKYRSTREMAEAANVTHSTVVKRIQALKLDREKKE